MSLYMPSGHLVDGRGRDRKENFTMLGLKKSLVPDGTHRTPVEEMQGSANNETILYAPFMSRTRTLDPIDLIKEAIKKEILAPYLSEDELIFGP